MKHDMKRFVSHMQTLHILCLMNVHKCGHKIMRHRNYMWQSPWCLDCLKLGSMLDFARIGCTFSSNFPTSHWLTFKTEYCSSNYKSLKLLSKSSEMVKSVNPFWLTKSSHGRIWKAAACCDAHETVNEGFFFWNLELLYFLFFLIEA